MKMIKNLLGKDIYHISLITSFVYVTVYLFETGVSSQLNIPFDFIIITIPTICSDLSYCLFTLFPAITIIIAIFTVTFSSKKNILKKMTPLFCGLSYILYLYFFIDPEKKLKLEYIFLGALCFTFIDDLIMIFYIDNKKTDKSRFGSVGRGFISFTMTLIFFGASFNILGQNNAQTQKLNFFIQGEKTYALAKIYGDNMFAYRVVNNTVTHELVYLRINNLNESVINKSKI